MDCNSIIYDCVRKVETRDEANIGSKGYNLEDNIISEVIAKIKEYITEIKPSNVLYIAFDGVAPFAKMEQQRTRRYKTGYLNYIQSGERSSLKFNTSAITPGTKFMEMLAVKVRRTFLDSNIFFGVKTVIVSASDESGEGEHKMFQYMRSNALQSETIAVYGLDADLIMLSLFHCFACENIYIFRESPTFGRAVLDMSFSNDELLYLDNRGLSKAILSEMGVSLDSVNSRGRIYDYIFACFLLGNDFLPHFPALNIRTHGNDTILETYKKVIAKHRHLQFISLETGNIQWNWVRIFLQDLARAEHSTIIDEYNSRGKMEKRFYPTTTQEEKQVAFDNIPTIYRAEEHYIQPSESGWEKRYYRVAFHLNEDPDSDFINKVCINYLEGLEWTFKYYTEGCPHWRWKYNYHYPPLFVDLVKRVPDLETVFIDEKMGINLPFKSGSQLAYVIPPWNHSMIPSKIKKFLDKNDYSGYYVDLTSLKFQWTFCKYFWESHVLLPTFSIEALEKIDNECK